MKNILYFFLFATLLGCGGKADYYDADGNQIDENPIYLDDNGVTVKAKDWAEINFIGKLNGVSYIIVDSLGLRKMAQGTFKIDFFDGELQPCTSRITNMNTMFQIRDTFENDTYEENFVIDYENSATMDEAIEDSKFEASMSVGGVAQDVRNISDLSSFDVSNVTSMDYMFAFQDLPAHDFSYWDVSNVVSMKGMFNGTRFSTGYYQDCNLTCDWDIQLRTPEWMEGSVVKWTANGEFITTNEMGHYNYPEKYLKNLKIDRFGRYKWDELPYDSFADFPQELKDIDREMRRDIERYNNTDDYEIFTANKWQIGNKVNQMGYEDYQFPAPVGEYVVKGGSGSNEANILLKVSPEGVIAGLKPLGVGLNHEGKVPDKYLDPPIPKNMFQNWDLSNLKDMSYMFFGSNFNLPISNWDVSNVESMAFTFGGVDVSNSTSDRIRKMFKLWRVNYPEKYWSKEAQKEIYKLSYDYSELSSLFTFNQDISSWNVSNVKCINRMFYGNYQFDQDLSKWDLSHLDQCREFDVATWNWDLPKPKLNCNKKPSIYKEFDKC